MPYSRLFVYSVLLSILVACSTSTAPEEDSASPTTSISVVMADVDQGVTADGYHFLGQESAPVVIQFYSDFF